MHRTTPELMFTVVPSDSIRAEAAAMDASMIPDPTALTALAELTCSRLPKDRVTALLMRPSDTIQPATPYMPGIYYIAGRDVGENGPSSPKKPVVTIPGDMEHCLEVFLGTNEEATPVDLGEKTLLEGFARALIQRRRDYRHRAMDRVALAALPVGILESGVTYLAFHNNTLSNIGVGLFGLGMIALAILRNPSPDRRKVEKLPALKNYASPIRIVPQQGDNL